MKKLVLLTLSLSFFGLLACQPPPAGGSKDLEDRIAKIEKKVAALEKRSANPRKRPERKPQTEAYKIPTGTSAVMGTKGAPITVTIFSDFQCPFCSRVDPMLHQLVKDPELKGKIAVVYKHFPLSFHKNAQPAARAAMAAAEQGEEYFWKMAEKLYSDQRALTPENFKKWAGEIGLDVAKFEADMKANQAKYDKLIQADIRLGQTAAKVRGTPSIFVNGWELRKRSVEGVKELVREKKLAKL